MDGAWFMLAFVWAIAETVQVFRKKPFPERMRAPVVWVALVGGFSAVGYDAGKHNDFWVFFVGAAFDGAAAALIYWLRLRAAQLWRKHVTDKREQT